MHEPETSFSVEVLGFPAGADPQALAESVSQFFGIPIEQGRRLVEKAPIRVKHNVEARVAQQLVRQLLKLGADVSVRNERSGAARTYRVAEGGPGRRSVVSSQDIPRVEDTLPSAD